MNMRLASIAGPQIREKAILALFSAIGRFKADNLHPKATWLSVSVSQLSYLRIVDNKINR
jgi:hypothetical protein